MQDRFGLIQSPVPKATQHWCLETWTNPLCRPLQSRPVTLRPAGPFMWLLHYNIFLNKSVVSPTAPAACCTLAGRTFHGSIALQNIPQQLRWVAHCTRGLFIGILRYKIFSNFVWRYDLFGSPYGRHLDTRRLLIAIIFLLVTFITFYIEGLANCYSPYFPWTYLRMFSTLSFSVFVEQILYSYNKYMQPSCLNISNCKTSTCIKEPTLNYTLNKISVPQQVFSWESKSYYVIQNDIWYSCEGLCVQKKKSNIWILHFRYLIQVVHWLLIVHHRQNQSCTIRRFACTH